MQVQESTDNVDFCSWMFIQLNMGLLKYWEINRGKIVREGVIIIGKKKEDPVCVKLLFDKICVALNEDKIVCAI